MASPGLDMGTGQKGSWEAGPSPRYHPTFGAREAHRALSANPARSRQRTNEVGRQGQGRQPGPPVWAVGGVEFWPKRHRPVHVRSEGPATVGRQSVSATSHTFIFQSRSRVPSKKDDLADVTTISILHSRETDSEGRRVRSCAAKKSTQLFSMKTEVQQTGPEPS